MKKATARELRNEFGKLSNSLDCGITFDVVKRGKPFAKTVPLSSQPSFVGSCITLAPLPDDLDEPVFGREFVLPHSDV